MLIYFTRDRKSVRCGYLKAANVYPVCACNYLRVLRKRLNDFHNLLRLYHRERLQLYSVFLKMKYAIERSRSRFSMKFNDSIGLCIDPFDKILTKIRHCRAHKGKGAIWTKYPCCASK